MSELVYERVQMHLSQLKLLRMAAYVDTVAEEAAKHEWTYLAFLDRLLDLEASARYERDVAMKTKLAHFPFPTAFDDFDFSFQPTINERQVRELATMRFLAHGENILLLGPPGVGKTHLAIALGTAAIAQRNTVYFLTMVDLIETLHKDAQEDRLGHRLRTLCKPKLLILDEMGYFPLDSLPARQSPLPQGQHHPHQQQVLRRMGRHLLRSRPRDRHTGSAAALLHHHQHPRSQLPPTREAQGRCVP